MATWVPGLSFKLGEPLTRLQLLELQAYTRDLEQKLLLYYQASTVGDPPRAHPIVFFS